MISTERSIAMMNHPRRVLTPGASRKRKERDGLETLKASTTKSTATKTEPAPEPPAPTSSNRRLAGYLAHEFLTQGTLFGQKWDPAAPVTAADRVETKKVANQKGVKNGGPEPAAAPHQSYVAVANLIKADGTHIPGIVNPTQLARWIQCERRV